MSTRHISLKVNGEGRTDAVDTRLLLVDYIRDTLGLTGAQRCSRAGCTGACTVLVNDWPVCACLTLAISVNGAALRTVEGFRCDDGSLHPLQQALVDRCPTLCSHCTAGTLVSAMALLEANPRPTREDVRRALSGNICRCSGYRKVVDAVMTAAQKLHAAGGASMNGVATTFGIATRLAGGSRGAADVTLPGLLQGRILTSPHPHAAIRRIDISKAYSVPGVVAIVTHADCPVNDGARPLLAGTAFFEGEWIAAVAAESAIAAEDALNLIDVDFDILSARIEPLQQEDDTSVLRGGDQPGDGSHEVVFSGIASRSLRADFALQAAVATLNSSGKPTIEAATPGNDAVSRLCGIAILLAERSARPVKVVEPEGVDLYARRSASLHKVKVRAGADGRLILAEHEAVVDAGAYPLEPLVTEGNIPALAGALAFGAVRSRVSKIKTNTRPKDRPVLGNEEGSFIFQQALDMMAEKAGLDPIEFRSRNRLPGDEGERLEDCLRAGAMRFGWSGKWRGWNNCASASKRYRLGAGLSILSRGKSSALFGHQADFVEVEVDIETGVTVLLSHVCALDVTGLLNAPDPTKLQAAFVAGIGDALLEEAAPANRIASEDKAAAVFRAPSIMDTLDVDYIFTGCVASPDAAILPGSDEVGFANLAPAIANAVYDAVGIRLRELPLSPEGVLRGLREKRMAGLSNAGRTV